MRLLPIIALLAACSPGPSEDTLVDELRIIAAVAEPPEVLPGETTSVDVLLADPLGAGATVAVWACTPADETSCVEAGSPLAGRLAVGELVDGHFVADLTVNPAWAAFASDEPIPSPLWVLACEPGACPQLDALGDALAAEAPTDAIEELMATPTDWVAELPLTGVTLGAKSLMVSTRDAENRNANPTLTVDGDFTSSAGEELTFEVSVEDDEDESVVEVMGLTTGGGFGLTAFAFLNGQAEMRWYAPDEPSLVRLYAVATDGVGGTAVWTGEATVE
ncbi:MAG: hypothetical protein KC912_18355 [Proteobacteria bacterium]|nr:hypothetical protein [Pseudomonadota bacterium]